MEQKQWRQFLNEGKKLIIEKAKAKPLFDKNVLKKIGEAVKNKTGAYVHSVTEYGNVIEIVIQAGSKISLKNILKSFPDIVKYIDLSSGWRESTGSEHQYLFEKKEEYKAGNDAFDNKVQIG